MTEPQRRYLFGAPGVGKSSRLVDLYIRAAESYGPDRVALVTYTRAAATELKTRLAAHFRTSEQAFPYVGTIHSMCYRLLGNPTMVDGRRGRFGEFCAALGIAPASVDTDPLNVETPFWWNDLSVHDEALLFRKLHATLIHRQQTGLDFEQAGGMDAERFRDLQARYHDWKQREMLLDFEDLLVYGAKLDLPVKVLLCDEVQDNSALMWYLTEQWARDKVLSVWAGDPWQSLFSFIGADPELFLARMRADLHNVVPLGDSHRLTHEAAQYAKELLVDGGHVDRENLHGTWDGIGGGVETDGTKFYLARTHNLLTNVRRQLEADGTPYADLRGFSPLSGGDGVAFRTLMRLQSGEDVGVDDFKHAAERCGVKLRAQFEGDVSAQDAAYHLGDLEIAARKLNHGDYLSSVYVRYGLRGLIAPPQVFVGTIHSAKGREADHVHLVTSWAYLPAQSRETDAGRRSESCTAYVAASRHRKSLTFLEGERGRRYPFP